jgi:hypothetical protein
MHGRHYLDAGLLFLFLCWSDTFSRSPTTLSFFFSSSPKQINSACTQNRQTACALFSIALVRSLFAILLFFSFLPQIISKEKK